MFLLIDPFHIKCTIQTILLSFYCELCNLFIHLQLVSEINLVMVQTCNFIVTYCLSFFMDTYNIHYISISSLLFLTRFYSYKRHFHRQFRQASKPKPFSHLPYFSYIITRLVNTYNHRNIRTLYNSSSNWLSCATSCITSFLMKKGV